MNNPKVEQLNNALAHVKSIFVGKDHIVDLMGICLVARENLFLLGPPGTAKSALVRALSNLLQGKSFEYLLTRFTEPNELFGPFDIRKLREGDLVTNTEGMLPEATLIFLDELLNANSAILNSLLMVLNERIFKRGRERRKIPALMTIGASNHLPEDESLQALFDRFLIRVDCNNVVPELLGNVLDAGWKLDAPQQATPIQIPAEDILELQNKIHDTDLSPIRSDYINLIQKLRNSGISVSDRRAVKLQRVVAASALLCHRDQAILSDLWVLKFIWDKEEEKEIIAGIVNAFVETDNSSKAQQHPRAKINELPDPDEIFKEIKQLNEDWDNPETTMAERASIKDRLRFLDTRVAWISNETKRAYVKEPMESLWQKILTQAAVN